MSTSDSDGGADWTVGKRVCRLRSEAIYERTQGRRHGQMVGAQGLASIARSKAVYSAIDSYALGGLKTECVLANSTGRQTEV